MGISDIISLFSGIALFLYGMSLMGDGLKATSGNKLESILYKLTGTSAKGMLLGCGVTAVIQSSSATSVIVMGFVNSGMMKLKQGIPVIMGAILGTSVTGWVICLSYIKGAGGWSDLLSTATLTGIVAVTGIILKVFCKGRTQRHIGDIMMGFAILMFGMSLMSSSVGGLKDQAWFDSVLTSMKNPLLGILAGVLIAALLQSASAAVGIIQALSVTGAVVFENALPLFMGISVGAALPVLIASFGTNTDGRRAALSYLISCAMGVAICASFYYIADAVFDLGLSGLVMNPFSLALVNTIFRLCMIVVLFPLVDVIEAIVSVIIPGEKTNAENKIVIDERFIRHPALAIAQSRTMLNEMAKQAGQSLDEAGRLIVNYNEEGYKKVEKLEMTGDEYEDVLGSFLMKLSSEDLTESQERDSTLFLHTLSDFERISDHALNIAESAREIHEKKIVFSKEAVRELEVVTAAVREILRIAVDAFSSEQLELAHNVEPLEEVIDDLCDEMKLRHTERLQQGICSINQGFVFNDLTTDLERISDHCSNVAVALIEIYSGSFDTHKYLGNVKESHNSHFEQCYTEYKSRFALHEDI